jgi:hypothetical protein
MWAVLAIALFREPDLPGSDGMRRLADKRLVPGLDVEPLLILDSDEGTSAEPERNNLCQLGLRLSRCRCGERSERIKQLAQKTVDSLK